MTVIREDSEGVYLKVEFPGYYFIRRAHPQAGPFLIPFIPHTGVTEPVGAPLLPAWRRLLSVPADAEIRFEVRARQSRLLFLPPRIQPLYPRQRPLPKSSLGKSPPFDFDLERYTAEQWFPETPARLLDVGKAGGQRLVLLELYPLRYHPRSLALAGFPEFDVNLRFDPPASPVPSPTPSISHLTTPAKLESSPRLLVLAPSSFHPTLVPLIGHREARGWTVDLEPPPATSPSAIRTWITNRYARAETRPSALLLIGDHAQIPCFAGTQEDRPDTDLYYACMDGGNDWQPEFPVGRLSATTPEQLQAIVEKIVAFETAQPDAWFLQAAFMAGTDRYTITEGTHDAVIAQWFDPRGYQSDRLYVTRFDATTANVGAAFNAGRLLGVYSGHGSETEWSDGPTFQKIHVLALTNENRYPLVLSFACLTGRFGGVAECFAETWQRVPRRGASAVLASSVTSYWEEDDVLERAFFLAIFEENRRPIGEALLRAKQKLLEHYGLTATVRRYYEQYNLLGDPLTPFREPRLSIVTSSDLPTAHVDIPFRLALQAVGGQEPYRWRVQSGSPPGGIALDPDTGILAGTPWSPVTGLTFALEVEDSAGAVTSRLFRQHVMATAFRIQKGLDAGPFPVEQPFLHRLEAAGGIEPYRWSLRNAGQYAAWTNTRFWVWTPSTAATGRKGDDAVWKLLLPWPFPFYGKEYSRLFISSNGYLDFRSRASEWDNTTEGLARNARIAPLWDDLVLTNLFVRIQASRVVIRWTGYTFAGRGKVDFQATLKRNGRILFAYRTGDGGKLSPTIGISAGDGDRFVLSPINGWASIPMGTGVKFAWRAALPKDVQLKEDGTLFGVVDQPGTWIVPVEVSDASVPPQSLQAPLTLRIE